METYADKVGQLTLDEACSLLSGVRDWFTQPIGRLDIPSAEVGDGPHGLRRETGIDQVWYPATCFPTASAMAATWDTELMQRVGAALGREAKAQGVGVLLGPGINIKRHPRCGRNFEYFSEDPALAGLLGAAYIRGVQSEGTGTSLKHFAANNQETARTTASSDVDERALREIYLAGFERAVAAGPTTVMCSYNRLNGVHASQHRWLLTEVLREQWGYDGLVVSDWNAVHDRVPALIAGLDLEMPGTGGGTDAQVAQGVRDGWIPRALVDRSAGRVLALLDWLAASRGSTVLPDGAGLPDGATGAATPQQVALCEAADPRGSTPTPDLAMLEAHHALAREAAERCIVLLRNEPRPVLRAMGGAVPDAAPSGALSPALSPVPPLVPPPAPPLVLPLNPAELGTVAVIGAYAATPRIQGGGSSRVNPVRVDMPLDELRAHLGPATQLLYSPGYPLTPGDGLRAGDEERAGTGPDLPPDEEAISAALAAASGADAVIVFVGNPTSWEQEAYDRPLLRLPRAQEELLVRLTQLRDDVVVVLAAGAAVDVEAWCDRAGALVLAGFAGQGMAHAVARVLVGAACPSGKLAETWPRREADTPAYLTFPGERGHVRYGEGVFVGYRWFDARGIEPRFPFGHGLSYTTFEYGSLQVAGSLEVAGPRRSVPSASVPSASVPDAAGQVTLSVQVTNTGRMAGTEVVQFYVSPPPGQGCDPRVPRPQQELRAFGTVTLQPGQTAAVSVTLSERDFAYWDSALGTWHVEPGEYTLTAAPSSRPAPSVLKRFNHPFVRAAPAGLGD